MRWVLVVLVAGFIGQFGRHAAQRLLERRTAGRPAEPDGKLVKKRLKARLKAEKKRAKAEEKRSKGQPG
ncbi:MAG: hypothetical protein XD60_1007 [Acetothermia bacterium 64_32]|nr:MAG: hypothetical protein XD60_1007 [Acetothermia bacterium 64_32]